MQHQLCKWYWEINIVVVVVDCISSGSPWYSCASPLIVPSSSSYFPLFFNGKGLSDFAVVERGMI